MTIAMAAALTACGHRASTDDGVDADSLSIDSTAIASERNQLKTDSIGIELKDSMVEVRVSVDWPVAGNDTLVQGVRQYIAKELDIKNYTDIKAALQKIAKRLLAGYWAQYAQLGSAFLENLQGMTTLKTYQADAFKNRQMNAENPRLFCSGANSSAANDINIKPAKAI